MSCRLTFPVIIGQGTRLFADTGPDLALDLVGSQTTPNGVTIQVHGPSGRPEYATSTAKASWRQSYAPPPERAGLVSPAA